MVLYDKFIPITPRPYPYPKTSHVTGKVYTPDWYKAYKNEIGYIVREDFHCDVFPPIFAVELRFNLKTPKYTSKNAGDVDNLAKGVLDALTGIVWDDDGKITQLVVSKYPSLNPGIYIYIQGFY